MSRVLKAKRYRSGSEIGGVLPWSQFGTRMLFRGGTGNPVAYDQPDAWCTERMAEGEAGANEDKADSGSMDSSMQRSRASTRSSARRLMRVSCTGIQTTRKPPQTSELHRYPSAHRVYTRLRFPLLRQGFQFSREVGGDSVTRGDQQVQPDQTMSEFRDTIDHLETAKSHLEYRLLARRVLDQSRDAEALVLVEPAFVSEFISEHPGYGCVIAITLHTQLTPGS